MMMLLSSASGMGTMTDGSDLVRCSSARQFSGRSASGDSWGPQIGGHVVAHQHGVVRQQAGVFDMLELLSTQSAGPVAQ